MAQTKTQKKAETYQVAATTGASLVPMTRQEPMFEGGPTECDVNAAEVERMKLAGWREA